MQILNATFTQKIISLSRFFSLMELNTGDSIHIDRGDKFLFVWFLIIKYVSSRKYSKFIFVIWWKEKSISELKEKL